MPAEVAERHQALGFRAIAPELRVEQHPVELALAIVLLIFAAVSAPAWFDRDKPGFAEPGLDEGILGLVTALIVPVQFLLIAFSMSGSRQAGTSEVERPGDEPPRRTPSPATA